MEFWSEFFLTGALSVIVVVLLGMLLSDAGASSSGGVRSEGHSTVGNDCRVDHELETLVQVEEKKRMAGGDFCFIEARDVVDRELGTESSDGLKGSSFEVSSSSVRGVDVGVPNEESADAFGLEEGAVRGERVSLAGTPSGEVVRDSSGQVVREIEEGRKRRGVLQEVDLGNSIQYRRFVEDAAVHEEGTKSHAEECEVAIQRCDFDLSGEIWSEDNAVGGKSMAEGEIDESLVHHKSSSEIYDQSTEVDVLSTEELGNEIGESSGVLESPPLIDHNDNDVDDEWEGIEQSELEKLFWLVNAYIGSGSGALELSKLSRDLQLRLYGLHKVATEGPCHEPQPIALKMLARAKWQAWQRLGNMNPEMAMEQYMNLLSESIPGWDRENLTIDIKRSQSPEMTTGTASSSDGSISTCGHLCQTGSTQEGTSRAEMEGSDFVNQSSDTGSGLEHLNAFPSGLVQPEPDTVHPE